MQILDDIEVAYHTGPDESSVSLLYVKQKEVRGCIMDLCAMCVVQDVGVAYCFPIS